MTEFELFHTWLKDEHVQNLVGVSNKRYTSIYTIIRIFLDIFHSFYNTLNTIPSKTDRK